MIDVTSASEDTQERKRRVVLDSEVDSDCVHLLAQEMVLPYASSANRSALIRDSP